jgi:coproporphyrinogen III oxidase
MASIWATSIEAKGAKVLVEGLQHYFVRQLDQLARTYGEGGACEALSWQRDEGRHGGGVRYETRDTLFNRGSVNISQVHYEDLPSKALGSATALSTIIHFDNPHAPSIHMHISWTQMKQGGGYWRIMGDLNPSLIEESTEDKEAFDRTLQGLLGHHYEEAKKQGDRYFTIPALGRTRGVSHIYLEGFSSGNFEADRALAQRVGEGVIDRYMMIVSAQLEQSRKITQEQREKQLAYHTLYLFQVLTLDRGTTSGLLVHDQNDVGIMGSLPALVDRELLASWRSAMPSPQEHLIDALLLALPSQSPTAVEIETKKALAKAVRTHYQAYPNALDLQARGDRVPPTITNHK